MDVLFLVGRVLFSALFLLSGVGHFTQAEQMTQYAKAAGVPAPRLAVLGSFNKNIALIGAALMLLLLRNWPLSLGRW